MILDSSLADRHAKSALDRSRELGAISELPDGILRQYLTSEHQRCNQTVDHWMQDAGMLTWQDAVGNQWGRLPSKKPDAPRLILGSHLDTVPYAGHYDGILGVLLGIEVASIINEQNLELPFHLDVVGFCDEEGTRFGATLIGSHALAGNFNSDWLDMQDKDGVSMAQAMEDFGLDPNRVGDASLKGEDIIGYWEVHIEQGPVLEAHDLSVGVVTAIAGARRAKIVIKGQAGHSGTTPMNLRKDPMCGAAELVTGIEEFARNCNDDRVATVGMIHSNPGAVNVIPGRVEMSLDVRSQNDDAREELIAMIESHMNRIAFDRSLSFEMHWKYGIAAAHCAQKFHNLFRAACVKNQMPAYSLPSGAGHDAMAIAPLCDMAMLFIRSPNGLSHHPAEAVYKSDVEDALKVIFSSINQVRA